MLEENNNNNITVFAKTNFRNQEQIFGIKRDDRRRHTYIIGKTGMGKTCLLENMIISDIINGEGCCYIDPHGDTAEKILNYIPADRINDVIYFNPADIHFPIAFNILEAVDETNKHLVASGLVGVFKKQFAESWGPRLEYILRNAILALLDYPGSTLLGIMRILVDKTYRKKVVLKIKDPVVRSFWTNEYTQWNERVLQEVISPIQNKVGQFLSNALIRNIVGQVKSTIDLRDVIDNKKILIMNLSKGRIGEDTMQLLGSMMVTKLYLAAMSRVDTPEDERRDFYLHVDEFQNFATESFASILSESRKYRLNLTIAHQYIEQLPEEVSSAVFGNIGTILSFRVGSVDADELVKEYTPVFTEEDLVNLPAFHIYLRLMIDGVVSDPFSAVTLPPLFKDLITNNEDKVIKVSRERYANPKEMVEDKINRWSGSDLSDKVVETVKDRSNKSDNKNRRKDTRENKNYSNKNNKNFGNNRVSRDNNEVKDNRYQNKKNKVNYQEDYIADCISCGNPTKLNFKPDGRKPVLCDNCLKKGLEETTDAGFKSLKSLASETVKQSGKQEKSISLKEAIGQKTEKVTHVPKRSNNYSGQSRGGSKPRIVARDSKIKPQDNSQVISSSDSGKKDGQHSIQSGEVVKLD